MWQAMIPAAMSVVGTMMQNDAAEDRAHAAMNFSANQAALQMEFQERMANTSYQRAVKDMSAAGLNPMLAYSQGGAATPTGAAGQGVNAPVHNVLGNAIASAQQVAQLDNIEADTAKKKEEARLAATQADVNVEELPVRRGMVGKQEQEVALLREQAAQTESYRYLNDEQRRLVFEEVKNAIEQNRRIRADTKNTEANTVLLQLQEKISKRESQTAEAMPRWFIDNIRWWLPDFLKGSSSAGQIGRAIK